MFIDPTGPRRLTEQPYAHVRDAIVEGRLQPGDVPRRLPRHLLQGAVAVAAPRLRRRPARHPPALAELRNSIDWCPPWPSQAALTRFVTDGHLDRHIVASTRRQWERRDRVTRRPRAAPTAVRPVSASAGLHIAVLVDADDGADDRALHAASAADDIVVGSLRRCYRSNATPGGLLLGFGSIADDTLDDAMDALDHLLRRIDRVTLDQCGRRPRSRPDHVGDRRGLMTS